MGKGSSAVVSTCMLGRELITELEAHRPAVAPCRVPKESRLAVVAGEYLLFTGHTLAVPIAVPVAILLSCVVFRVLLPPPWSAEQQEARHRGAARATPAESDALLLERDARERRSVHLNEHGSGSGEG